MQSPPPSLRVFEHGVAGDARRGGGVRHVAAVIFPTHAEHAGGSCRLAVPIGLEAVCFAMRLFLPSHSGNRQAGCRNPARPARRRAPAGWPARGRSRDSRSPTTPPPEPGSTSAIPRAGFFPTGRARFLECPPRVRAARACAVRPCSADKTDPRGNVLRAPSAGDRGWLRQ